jgi:hypothetical protein
MQSITKDIEAFYRLETDSFSFNITNDLIKVELDGDLKKEIDPTLVIRNGVCIAWVEHDIRDNFFKIIISNYQSKTSNSFPLFGEPDIDGYEFFSFTWIDSSLFCIYMGDHNYFYIQAILNNSSKRIFIRGDAVRVFENFLTFQQYGRSEPVYKATIPELSVINQYSEEEAKSLNIMPSGLGLIYGSDHNFYELK